MKRYRVVALLGIAGAALVVIGLIVGPPQPTIEGAYFNRSVGTPAIAVAIDSSQPGSFDPRDGNLWIGAGLAVLCVSVTFAALVRASSLWLAR